MDTQSDIGIIVEGSYPYVAGGVASWLQQLMQKMPDFSFDLILLLARPQSQAQRKYEIPANVRKITEVYLHQGIAKPMFLPRKCLDQDLIRLLIHQSFDLEVLREYLGGVCKSSIKKRKESLLYSLATFRQFADWYQAQNLEQHSFLDYFWQMRSICMSLFNLITAQIPQCRVYHALSTGYAGLLLGKLSLQYPESTRLVTEHGIYTRERSMEIMMTHWPNQNLQEQRVENAISFYAETWQRLFRDMATVCYQSADQILSLYERNNEIQIQQGAPKDKTSYVFNGINLKKFVMRQGEMNPAKPRFGFLGRVVKIKDVKTLIRACAIVKNQLPQASFIIAGPTDEDPQYATECQKLAGHLNLLDQLTFPGPVQAASFFHEIDVMVLTSLSEGQPLVILEGFACGVPCVATDVGACREIILGNSKDRLGPAGEITEAINPVATAEAMLNLVRDQNRFTSMCLTARKRAETFYDEDQFLHSYHQVYTKLLDLARSRQQNGRHRI